MRKNRKHRLSALAAFTALAIAAGLFTGLGLPKSAKADDVTVTVKMNGGEYATSFGELEIPSRSWDVKTTVATEYADADITVSVPAGKTKLTHDFVQNTLFAGKVPLFKKTDSHAPVVWGSDIEWNGTEWAPKTKTEDNKVFIEEFGRMHPTSGGWVEKEDAETVTGDEITGWVYDVPMLKGIKDSAGNTYLSGDEIDLSANATLTCYWNESDIQYGRGFDSFDYKTVCIKKAWSPINMPFGDEETGPANFTARDIQLFYHKVTSVGRIAFRNDKDNAKAVKTVELPDTVTDICEQGFKGCSAMTEFKGLGVKKLFKEAFDGVRVANFYFGPLELIRRDWWVIRSWVPKINLICEGGISLAIKEGDGNPWMNGDFAGNDNTATIYVEVGNTAKVYEGGGTVLDAYTYGEGTPRLLRTREMFIADFDLNGGAAPAGFKTRRYQDAGAVAKEIAASTPYNNVRAGNPADIDIISLCLGWPGTPTREGYNFKGWKNTNGNAVWFDADDFSESGNELTAATTDANGKTVFQAVWEEIVVEHTVTFDLNYTGSTGAPAPATVTDGGKVTAPTAPSRTGYTFGGWFKEAACTAEWAFGTDTVTASRTLYAKWIVDNYTITYNLNGGTVSGAPGDYTIESTAITLPTPTKTGYTFGGWYSNAEFTGGAVTSIAAGSTGNKEFFAKWTVDNYTITYNLDDGTNASGNPASYTIESAKITLAAATKAGYTFDGWYGEAAFNNKVTEIAAGSTGNKTLYAKWTAVPAAETFTVTFNLNGAAGTAPAAVTADEGSKITKPADPAREGYTFKGWFKEAAGTTEWVFGTDTVTANTTLYAKWEKNADEGGCKSNAAAIGSLVALLGVALLLKKRAV